MNKTMGVFAHVDAGKTTFCEQVLYHGKAIRKRGRVDHKDAFFDGHALEKERGITIFSEQGYFSYGNDVYDLIDTPGHVDFSSEMERAIQVMDYAIVIVSAIDGVQSHTRRVYDLLSKQGLGIFFFVNKMDANHSDFPKVLDEIKALSEHAVDFEGEDFYEEVSNRDELLMAYFFDDDFGEGFNQRLKALIKVGTVMPVYKGSALKDDNIEGFMAALHRYSYMDKRSNDLSGIVYKIRHDSRGVRESYVKLNSGTLSVRDHTPYGQITEIRRYQGSKYESLKTMVGGQICGLIGLDAKIKDGFGDFKPYVFESQATMMSALVYDDAVDPRKIYKDLKVLALEDPMLHLTYEPLNKTIKLGVMGQVQLEVLKTLVWTRFAYEVDFEPPQIIYKESIRNTVVGYGHFEPLKHYAEVHLKLEPNPAGGIIFESQCPIDDLNQGHQNLVKHHIFEKAHRGVLTGSELTAMKITLVTGRAHEKHTSGGDFREATLRALRQGLEGAEVLLLEPYHQVVVITPAEFSGRIMTDLSTFMARAIESETKGDYMLIRANVAVAKIRDYNESLMNFSRGTARMHSKFIGYQACDNVEEVVDLMAYDKVRDLGYPSSSVFCHKGKGYTVPWQEAKAHMHCGV